MWGKKKLAKIESDSKRFEYQIVKCWKLFPRRQKLKHFNDFWVSPYNLQGIKKYFLSRIPFPIIFSIKFLSFPNKILLDSIFPIQILISFHTKPQKLFFFLKKVEFIKVSKKYLKEKIEIPFQSQRSWTFSLILLSSDKSYLHYK